MSDTQQQQINLTHDDEPTSGQAPDTQSQAGTDFGGKDEKHFGKNEQGETEVKPLKEGEEASDEEMDKVELRLAEIIDGALKGIKPFLKLMVERCEEAEDKKKKNKDFDEDEFVKSVEPIIREASGLLNSTLDQIKALDPEQKVQRRAKRNAEDQKASKNQEVIAKGLAELSESVTKTIEECKKKLKDLPKAKSKLGPMFNMLSEPLFQILSAVGLLVYGVLNLVGRILDSLGLGGVFRGLCDGLGISTLLKTLGWKVQIVKSDQD